MDKVFGGGEKRGIIQGILLIVVGIILMILPSMLISMSVLLVFTNPAGALQMVLLGASLYWPLNIIGWILIIVGAVGIIWFIVRKAKG